MGRDTIRPFRVPILVSRRRNRGVIEQLWGQHEAAGFPRASRCREVAGHDHIALDYTTAGCVSVFLTWRHVDTWRLAVPRSGLSWLGSGRCRGRRRGTGLLRTPRTAGRLGPRVCSRGSRPANHKGLESAKPDLQSLFKKPGGATAPRRHMGNASAPASLGDGSDGPRSALARPRAGRRAVR